MCSGSYVNVYIQLYHFCRPVIESQEFYQLFPALKRRLDKQKLTHKTAGEFLHTVKTLMAKLKVSLAHLTFWEGVHKNCFRQMTGVLYHVRTLKESTVQLTNNTSQNQWPRIEHNFFLADYPTLWHLDCRRFILTQNL
jgi:hypothetical protein